MKKFIYVNKGKMFMKYKTDNLPMLSIIIPVYNVEHYIERCVKSIIDQEYYNWEIIAVDDGSKDSSGIILEKLSKADKRIHILHVMNGGVSKARNIGLLNAKGEYITFVDADDMVKYDIYSKMIHEAIANKCDIVQCNYEELFENGSIRQITNSKKGIYTNKDDIIIACMERSIYANVFTKIYKKDVIQGIMFDEKISYAEDLKFVVECCNVSERISILNFIGYQYFLRSSSVDRSIINEKFLSVISVSDFFISKYKYNNFVYFYVEKNDVLQTKYLIDRISSQRGKMQKYLPILRKRILEKKDIIWKSDIYRNEDKIKIFLLCFFPNFYYFIYYIYNKFVKKSF